MPADLRRAAFSCQATLSRFENSQNVKMCLRNLMRELSPFGNSRKVERISGFPIEPFGIERISPRIRHRTDQPQFSRLRRRRAQNGTNPGLCFSVIGGFFLDEKTDLSFLGFRRGHELPNRIKDHLDPFIVRSDLPLQLR